MEDATVSLRFEDSQIPFALPALPFHARDKLFLDLLSDQNWSPIYHNTSLAPDGGAFTTDELFSQIEKRPNFKLVTHTGATRILCSSKERATAIECWDTTHGVPVTIGAQTVVVRAGGIETPSLLRQSANEWCPDGWAITTVILVAILFRIPA